jgi:hypothetical protein
MPHKASHARRSGLEGMRTMDKRLIRVSKYLSKYLQHSPHEWA